MWCTPQAKIFGMPRIGDNVVHCDCVCNCAGVSCAPAKRECPKW